MKLKYLPFIILSLLCLFALKTYWGPDFFDGHDAQNHIVRLSQYDKALKDGQFPPRWAGDLLAGRGYPVFIFAYPIPYALAEAFHLTGFNLAVSLKLTFALGYLTSVLAMYHFANKYWQSRLAGFITAMLWAFAPYMFVKLFITASLGVIVSYAFIPLFFLNLYYLLIKPSLRSSFFLGLTSAAWLLSHSFTPIIFCPLILLFSIFNLKKKKIKLTFKHLVFAILFCIIFSAWHLYPALTELKYTHFDAYVTHEFADHFVSLKRLLYSTWGTGAPGWSDNPLSQQVGIAQWLAIAISLFFLLPARSSLAGRKAWPFILSFFLSIFLMLSISTPVWELIPLLATVHIPWRFLSLAVFTAAISSGFVIKALSGQPARLFVVLFFSCLALYANRNHLRINQAVTYDQQFFDSYKGVATGWNEHLPIWVKTMPKDFPKEKIEIISGDCAITKLSIKSNLQSFSANCTKPSIIQLNTAYYPRWQITVNNQDISDQVKKYLLQSNGMIRFSLSTGQHQIKASFN